MSESDFTAVEAIGPNFVSREDARGIIASARRNAVEDKPGR